MSQSYNTKIDIANRALQHVGVPRIVTFADDTKAAGEVNFAYDKVRRAELRRNAWRCAIRNTVLRPVNSLSTILGQNATAETIPLVSMMFTAPTYSSGTTYALGAIVADSNGTLWQSQIGSNIGNALPSTNTSVTDGAWVEFFGSLQVNPYDTTNMTGYYPGELVYEITGPGLFNVFLALCYTGSPTAGNSSSDPSSWPAYNATTTYYAGEVILDVNSTPYMCLQNEITGIEPSTQPAWSGATAYVVGNSVTASDGVIYQAIVANTNMNPSGGAHAADWVAIWTPTFTAALGSDQWQLIAGTLTPINLLYPVGAGPAWQTYTKNVFMLPNGFLRTCPQDPKAGSVSFLGGPSGQGYSDWDFEGGYITSQCDSLIMLKFIADINEVTSFDDMFCEGLACRLAMAICEPLTQSTAKMQVIEAEYSVVMREARTVNGIETGATEAPEDDYIQCRV